MTDQYNYDLPNLSCLYFVYEDFEEIYYSLKRLEEYPDLDAVVIYSAELELLWADFRAHFTEIDAAGGVVLNTKNQVLLIYRNNKWDLPKGKMEADENPKDCALREVEEECGAKGLTTSKHIGETYHTYSINDKPVLKRTFWYEMRSHQQTFEPQTEEGITKVEWCDLQELDLEALDTFENIRLLLRAYTIV